MENKDTRSLLKNTSIPLSRHSRGKIYLVWTKSTAHLYQGISFNIIREICQFLTFQALLVRCKCTELTAFDPSQKQQWTIDYCSVGISGKYNYPGSCVCVGDSQIFVCGGMKNQRKRSVPTRQTFALDCGQMLPLNDMLQGRYSHGLYFHEASRRVFAFGGDKYNSIISEQYDLDRNTWLPLPPMLTISIRVLTCGYKGKVFLCRGRQGCFEVFTINTQQFAAVPVSLTCGGFPCFATVWGNQLIVIKDKSVRRWDANTFQLLAETSLEEPWTVTSQTLVVHDFLYAFDPEWVCFQLRTMRKIE